MKRVWHLFFPNEDTFLDKAAGVGGGVGRFNLGRAFMFGIVFRFFVGFFSLLASWLFGLLASGLLGFSAFCWFMRLLVAFLLFASSAFPVPLRQVAFWLLLVYAAFGGFGFSHPSGFWAFAPFHWFLDLASRIISITTTPNPPATVCTPI